MNTAIVIFLISALTGLAIYPVAAEAFRHWRHPLDVPPNPRHSCNTTEEKKE